MYAAQSALAQYKRINTESALEGASPHQLIQMLLNGALERLTQAKGALARQDVAQKGLLMGKAISIVGGLRASLDENAEPQMTANLSSLYEYMQRRLLEANLHNDVALIDEVIDLLTTVKEGWDAIAPAPTHPSQID